MPSYETAARLLRTERDALLPILANLDSDDFDRPTCLPGWSVRDVLAHCAAAFTMTMNRSWHGFTPEENQRDVDDRKGWPVERVLAELETGYETTAELALGMQGRLDGLCLGEWVHGGDVREALGVEDAYASAGVDDALELIVTRSRARGRDYPGVAVRLPDRELELGSSADLAELACDAATLVRLIAGRDADPGRFRLDGVRKADLRLFD